jgi:tetratricopeptide (TPR) repeat protein
MRSQFSAQTLAEIFRDLYMHERTGVLVLSHADRDKSVHFDRGMILFAESAEPGESLGEWLVRSGRLSSGALAEAQASLAVNEGTVALARALIHRELLGRSTLASSVNSLVERVVESVFGWEGGTARFVEGEAPETPFDADTLSTVNVILSGISCMAGFEPIHEAMQGLDNRLRIRNPTPFPLERLALSPSNGFTLSRVDGSTNLTEVISILPPGEEEVAARFLFGLLVMGVVEYEPPLSAGPFQVADILRDHADRQALERLQEQLVRKAYARSREQGPYEVLGVPVTAGRDEIERGYEELKREFSRERILPKVRDKYRTELTLIESRLIEAYLTLTQPDRSEAARSADEAREARQEDLTLQDLNVRVEMDRAKAQVAADKANRVADAYYAKSRKAILEGDFHNAIQFGKLAISYNPSDARFYFLIADCQARNPDARWQRMAEENFSKATELDPWNAEYWISLGRLYKKRGLKLRARRQFEEALKLVPNHPEVVRELESLR